MAVTTCEGCGACCKGQPYPPFMWIGVDVPPDDCRAVIEASIYAGDRDDSAPCLWLGADDKCIRYEDRPEICRDFELGGEDCLYVRQVYQIGGAA